jgi:hypothetical protein
MTPATQEQPPRPNPARTLLPPDRPPQAPARAEPPPAAERKHEDHPADEPGYGHGV